MHIIELKHVPLLETLPEKEMEYMQAPNSHQATGTGT